MKINSVLIVIFFIAASCTLLKSTSYKVEYKGALKEIMFEGNISARIDLAILKQKPHLFALGSVENLKGEIMILDGKSYVSSITGGKVATDTSFSQKASLLVYVQVKEWVAIPVPDHIRSYEALETYLPQIGKEKGLNINKPFPFLLKGKALSVHWHVIDWKEGDREHTHEKHKNAGASGIAPQAEATILGFYSNKHHRIWTHHDTNMHLHAYLAKEGLSVHVDGLSLQPGSTLLLPVVK